jgi:hypothetical protein
MAVSKLLKRVGSSINFCLDCFRESIKSSDSVAGEGVSGQIVYSRRWGVFAFVGCLFCVDVTYLALGRIRSIVTGF